MAPATSTCHHAAEKPATATDSNRQGCRRGGTVSCQAL